VNNSVTLTLGKYVIINATNVTVDAGASISANGQGYAGGSGGNPGGGPGGGGGSGEAGSYGGLGNSGNLVYGVNYQPTWFGSGGSGYIAWSGASGNGGGLIWIQANDTINVTGSLLSYGGPLSGTSEAAGAGGTIFLQANNLIGNGVLNVSGLTTSLNGRTGGGGRIAENITRNVYSGSTITTGNHVGTLYTQPNVTLNSPALASTSASSTVNFTFNVSAVIANQSFVNASLWTNASGSWAYNGTTTNTSAIVSSVVNGINVAGLTGSTTYLWNIEVCDNETYCGFSNKNFTVTTPVPPVAPYIVNILVPANQTTVTQQYLNLTAIAKSATTPFLNATLFYNTTSVANSSAVSNATAFNFNQSLTTDGEYYFNVSVYTAATTQNTSQTQMLKVATQPDPAPTLNAPVNGSYINIASVLVTFYYTPIGFDIVNVTLFLNNSASTFYANSSSLSIVNNTVDSFTLPAGQGIANQSVQWRVQVCDFIQTACINSSIFTAHVDTAVPTVTLNSPANAGTTNNLTFYYTPSEGVYGILKNSSLWTNASGGWAVNVTNSSALVNGSSNSIVATSSVPITETLLWNVQTCDQANNCGFAPANFTLTEVVNVSFSGSFNNTGTTKANFSTCNYTNDYGKLVGPVNQTVANATFNLTYGGSVNATVYLALNTSVTNYTLFVNSTRNSALIPANSTANATLWSNWAGTNTTYVWTYLNCTNSTVNYTDIRFRFLFTTGPS